MGLHRFIASLVCLVCLNAYIKQAKKEPGFSYQIMVAISECFELAVFEICAASLYGLSGYDHLDGASWFMSCYFCMLYTAHITVPLLNALITQSLYLSLGMAVERVYALSKPMRYQNMSTRDHRKHEIIVCSLSAFIGFSTSIFNYFRYEPILHDDGLYSIETNPAWTSQVINGLHK